MENGRHSKFLTCLIRKIFWSCYDIIWMLCMLKRTCIGTFLDIDEKSKNTLNVCKDLQKMRVRDALHPITKDAWKILYLLHRIPCSLERRMHSSVIIWHIASWIREHKSTRERIRPIFRCCMWRSKFLDEGLSNFPKLYSKNKTEIICNVFMLSYLDRLNEGV